MSEVAKLNTSMGSVMESVLIDGDLAKLTSEQRVTYYKKTCESLGLNYLTKPFAYIRLNGKLTFYALKDCTEQLRKRDGVSIIELKTQNLDGVFVVTAYARSSLGKEDVATGAVPTGGLKGESLANALMKAETKAKRRVTLSICGLGMTDEEEISSIPMAQKVHVDLETGVIETTVTEVQAISAPKSDEEVLAAITSDMGQELANEISTARDIDSLKSAYARCYALHAGRLPLMVEFTKLKDMRKNHLETYTQEQMEGTFDDPMPNLTEGSMS